MLSIIIFCVATVLIAQALIGLNFFVSSVREREKRASIFAGLQFLGMLALAIVFFIFNKNEFFTTDQGRVLLIAGTVLGLAACIFFLRRTAPNEKAFKGTNGLIVGKVQRFHESQIVYARNELIPETEPYKRYYQEHPEHEVDDAKRRAEGRASFGQFGMIDRPHEKPNEAAAMAPRTFNVAIAKTEIVKPDPKHEKLILSPEEATEWVKGFAKNVGADLVGIAEVNPLWVYSHRGRVFHDNWEDWGQEIQMKHPYAIIMASEMSFDIISSAPHTPIIVESMNKYAKGAYIATLLARYIANLGYSATANHHRHYELNLVPVAVDAGLGETGRLGYLITKEFGPRVRLSAVTTDLPLTPDHPVDIGVEDFCKICKKCAVCCPSKSIPLGPQDESNGILRWKLNDETCFEYFRKCGTDCGVCMRVCPWGHETSFPHKMIRFMNARNAFARRLFSRMDDIFYGSKPKPKPELKWVKFS
jgi:reductive dehalogenase